MDKVKLGIIGIGNIGTTHTKLILEGQTPEIELTAVADRSPQRRDWAASTLGTGFPVFEEGSDLISKSNADAVLISVPHYQHPSLSIEAFKAALHVLCEKPAGVFTKQVREMNEAAEKSGKVFAMMFNQRTNSRYKKMYELVKGGSYGQIMRTSWIITDWFRSQAYYDSGGWRGTWDGEGGGVLLNQSPHQLDLFQWICGLPKKVRAYCHYGKWHNIDVEDDVTAYLEYPNGATGTFITSTGETPGTNRFEISMERGKIVNDGGSDITLYNLETNLRDFCKTSKDNWAAPACKIEKPEIEDDNPQHAGIIRNFAAGILRGEKLVARGAEGINALTLSNAMHLSSWLDKTVELPFDEDLFLEELNKRRKKQ
jgi:predicted dehydrogenase